jgi:threonine dehydrogenase-like Zn-dependent dehydrogenase
MRAVVLDTDGRPVLTDVPAPTPAAEVLACGLSGSDVEKIGAARAGTVLGHEVVARVDGERIALIDDDAGGGFAEAVRAADGVELDESLSDAVGTYVQPLACVIRALEHLPRGRVLVVGDGFVGRLFVELLRLRGDDVFAPEPDRPVDAAVVCGPGGDAALAALEPGGTLLVCAAGGGRVDLDLVYRRGLAVQGLTSAAPRHLEEAAALLPALTLPEPLVLPLERFAEGLERYRSGEALRVVFTP